MFKKQLTMRSRWVVTSVSICLVSLVWWVGSFLGYFPTNLFPSPYQMIESFPSLYYDHFLFANLITSFSRILLGFLVAALAAIPLGLLMGSYPIIKSFMIPHTEPLRFLPIAAVVPVFIYWFGFGEFMKIAILAVGTFVYLLPLVVESVENIPDVYLKVADSLGYSSFQKIVKILLPASSPLIWEALRVMFGLGWTYVMLAEFVSVSSGSSGFWGHGGVGYLLNQMQRYGTLADIFTIVFMILIFGVCFDRLMAWLGTFLFPWHKN